MSLIVLMVNVRLCSPKMYMGEVQYNGVCLDSCIDRKVCRYEDPKGTAMQLKRNIDMHEMQKIIRICKFNMFQLFFFITKIYAFI